MPLHSSKLVQLIQPKVAALLELTGDSPDAPPPSLLSAPHEYLAETLTRQATVLSFERESHLISSQQEREREVVQTLVGLSSCPPATMLPSDDRKTDRQVDFDRSIDQSQNSEVSNSSNNTIVLGYGVIRSTDWLSINANNRRLSIPLDSPYFRVSVH